MSRKPARFYQRERHCYKSSSGSKKEIIKKVTVNSSNSGVNYTRATATTTATLLQTANRQLQTS